jgi:RNA polymerase sigma-70 factor (ECF subfamily)
MPDEADPAASPEARLEARGEDERVRTALAALPTRQREALVLTYYQEMSNLDAAALMGISVDALESLLARARRTLRAQLAGSGLSKDKS